MLNVKRYDIVDNYGNYTKNYLNPTKGNNLGKGNSVKSISLNSSPIHQSNSASYSRSTNSTPQHFYQSHLNCESKLSHNTAGVPNYNYQYNNFKDSNEETNLDDYLEYEQSSSLEDLNCEFNNQNSSNDEYDNCNSEESNDGEHCNKLFNKRLKLTNKLTNQLLNNQTYIKHSRSYQNQFFDIIDSPTKLNLLDKKATSLSLSGNNLKNLNSNNSSNSDNDKNQQSPNQSPRKTEFFIMTGQAILSLSRSNSEENPMIMADIANFKANAKGLNRPKLRKLRDEKRKESPSKVNSNNSMNSDQVRACLSPELKSTNNQLEMVNNSINNLLTISFMNESNAESMVYNVDKESNQDNGNAESNNDKDVNILLLDNTADQEIKLSNECLIETTENNELILSEKVTSNAAEETISTLLKRYPTFIQQEANESNSCLINEQLINPQKSIDEASARRLAKRLYNLDKFKKLDVTRHLCKNNEFSKAVGTEYFNYFDFENMSLIDALRKFLSKFCLIGETTERERILLYFSKRFFACNPSTFSSVDSIFNLTCSLVMLNQDLHGDCVSKKMTLNDFIENLKSLNDGQNFSKDLLKKFYTDIKNDKLECLNDDDDQLKDDKFSGGTLTIANTILEMPNNLNSSEYKRGYILRKCCLQANGKKVSLGKRSWKSFYAILRDTYLYLHKDDQSLAKNQIYDSVKNSIRIHHAFCSIPDYKKKEFVFRLSACDGSEYLISVNSKQELESWMDSINFVAAAISAPKIDSQPCTSNGKKKKYPQKPILPTNVTKYQFKEQLNDHESRRIRLNDEIQDITHSLRSNYNLVGKKAKNAVLQLKYLKTEYERYTAYCKVMKKVKLNGNGILEKASKSLATKSKPLTTLNEASTKSLDDDEQGF